MTMATSAHHESSGATNGVARPPKNVEVLLTSCGTSAFAALGWAYGGFATPIAYADCGGTEGRQKEKGKKKKEEGPAGEVNGLFCFGLRSFPIFRSPFSHCLGIKPRARWARKLLICEARGERQPVARIGR